LNSTNYIAFHCANCHTVNVFPKSHPDGHNCRCCGGGSLIPIGDAVVEVPHPKNTIEVGIQLNGTDEAMKQISMLNDAAKQAKESLESIRQMLR